MATSSTTALPLLPDLPEGAAPTSPGPPPTSPAPSGRHSPSRKDQIFNLVEMILEGQTAARANTLPPNFEDDRDVPSVDEYLQEEGAESFHKFSRSVTALDKELRNFANASRQLGSSVAILSSGFRLRERLAQLLYLYRENAADLFPRKVSHVRDNAPVGIVPPRKKKRKWGKAHLNVPRPVVSEGLEADDLPYYLEALAKDVKTFLNCLNEFPEFTDEAVNASILSFEGDLRYWASCLKEYTGQFRNAAVQRYIHELSQDMGDHINGITSSLCMFIEVGVPTIRFAQKHGSSNLLNLSTIATFFSAVTATTMQFSYELPSASTGGTIVNCFWFASLVFSIAAAVNSLLGLTWKQAMYRSPGHRVPWWVLIWIKRSPLVFLVLSVACFSIGLCAFTYASNQSQITSTLTTVLTAFTSFGLAAVSTWFASERWTFSRHRGQKWLSDVLNESKREFVRHPWISWIYTACKFLSRHLVRLHQQSMHVVSCVSDIWCCHLRGSDEHGNDDVEANSLSFERISPNSSSSPENEGRVLPMGPQIPPDIYTKRPMRRVIRSPIPIPTPPNSPVSLGSATPSDLMATATRSAGAPLVFTRSGAPLVAEPIAETAEPEGRLVDGEKQVVLFNENATAAPAPPSNGKLLWKSAIRKVQVQSTLSQAPPSPFRITPQRKPTDSSSIAGAPSITGKKNLGPEPSNARSRISALVHKLAELEATQDLPAHSALVKHIQFSPDGRYLATSSWDKSSVIFKVGDPFISHRILSHTEGFIGQVAWSPDSKILLTKLGKGVKVWTAEHGVCIETIDRNTAVEALTWMPDGGTFLSVEESSVTKLNLRGQILDTYYFGQIKLHDVAVTPDSLRLIGVGPLLQSPSGLQPSKSRVEKQLVVYNIESKSIESQTPLLNEVRDITIANAKSGVVALVSYENKAPPQLWKVEKVPDRETGGIVARLTLRHTYMPKTPVDFAGPSYFGGKNNELVLCTGKAGDVHIWDQESGALLHVIRAKLHGGDLTSIAWNHSAEDPYMFATGSHDGGVRVWTRFEESTNDDPTSQGSHTADYFSSREGGRPLTRQYKWDTVRSMSPEAYDDEDARSMLSRRGSLKDLGLEMASGSKKPQKQRQLSWSSSDSSRL